MGPPYSKPCSSPPLHFLFAFRGLSKCSRGSDGSDIFPFLERKFTHFFFFSKNFNKTEKHRTIVAALDMPLPEDYIRRLAPPPRSDLSLKCAVTGEPAKYRDPVTGAPYATVEAFKTLRARGVVGSAAAGAGAPAAGPKAANVAAAGKFLIVFLSSFRKTRSLCTEAPGFFYS